MNLRLDVPASGVLNIPDAIVTAGAALNSGDVMFIEQHAYVRTLEIADYHFNCQDALSNEPAELIFRFFYQA